MILSLPIGITVEDAQERIYEALPADKKPLFLQNIARDPGSFIYMKTVAKSLGVTLLPVAGRSSGRTGASPRVVEAFIRSVNRKG